MHLGAIFILKLTVTSLKNIEFLSLLYLLTGKQRQEKNTKKKTQTECSVHLSPWAPWAAHLCSYNAGHVLHHFMLQESCLLGSGALPGRYGFLFLFLTPSAPLESSSAGSRSRLESDFVSQSRSSASVRGKEKWWLVTAQQLRTPQLGPSKTLIGSVSFIQHHLIANIDLIKIKFTSPKSKGRLLKVRPKVTNVNKHVTVFLSSLWEFNQTREPK